MREYASKANLNDNNNTKIDYYTLKIKIKHNNSS